MDGFDKRKLGLTIIKTGSKTQTLSINKTGLTQKQGIVNDQHRIEPTDGYTIRDLEEVSRLSQQSQAETKLGVPEGWRRDLKLDDYIGTLWLRPDVEILLSVPSGNLT